MSDACRGTSTHAVGAHFEARLTSRLCRQTAPRIDVAHHSLRAAARRRTGEIAEIATRGGRRTRRVPPPRMRGALLHTRCGSRGLRLRRGTCEDASRAPRRRPMRRDVAGRRVRERRTPTADMADEEAAARLGGVWRLRWTPLLAREVQPPLHRSACHSISARRERAGVPPTHQGIADGCCVACLQWPSPQRQDVELPSQL